MIYGNDVVLTGLAVVMWDGITRPEVKDDGRTQWSLKVAMVNQAPEIAEINTISTKALQNGQFKGVLPTGGHWPIINRE